VQSARLLLGWFPNLCLDPARGSRQVALSWKLYFRVHYILIVVMITQMQFIGPRRSLYCIQKGTWIYRLVTLRPIIIDKRLCRYTLPTVVTYIIVASLLNFSGTPRIEKGPRE
jgi:hypothetical protein